MQVKKQGKFRFDEFEVDLAARSLRREGRFVAISPKTFELLTVFISHPGRLITQDELLHSLWRDATLEESNLAQHIFLLRKALAGYEPGENCLSVIPRKGYLFTASVTPLPDEPLEISADPQAAEEAKTEPDQTPHRSETPQKNGHPSDQAAADAPRSPATPMLLAPGRNPIEATLEEPDLPRPRNLFRQEESTLDEPGEPDEAPPAPQRWMPWIVGGIAAVIILAVVGALFWKNTHLSTAQTLGLVVGDFQNSTGHRELDNALRTVLVADLEQSPYLNVASAEKIQQSLRNAAPSDSAMALSAPASDPAILRPAAYTPDAAAPLSAGRAREGCRRLNDQAYLTGSVKRLALKYMVTVQAFNCASDSRIAQSRGIADTPDGVLAVMAKVAADIRKQMGEPVATVERFSKPLFAGGTSTAIATEAYAEGLGLSMQGRADEAAPMLQRATELDPQFALAFAALGETYAGLNQRNLAAASLSKAYELRNTLDDLHRLAITSLYYDTVTGDLNAGMRNDREWIGLYPRQPAPYADLADLQIQMGKPALALEPARRALELDPQNPLAYVTLARAQMHLGQFEEAASVCRQAISRHLDVAPIHNFLLQIAFLRLDQPAMDEELAWARNRPSEPYMLLQQAMIDFALGKVKAAQTVMAGVVAAYRKQGEDDRANRMQSQVPRIEAELGLVDSATALLGRLPQISGSTDIPVAWAEVGETARAESLRSAELDAHPAATLWQEYDGPQIAAAIALSQHKPESAVESLEGPSRYDLRSFDVPALRGRALLAAKQPAFAEAEFHHILDHPGIEPFSHNYPLAQLGLARALAQQEKFVDAGFAYKVLLSIWKDADPELPRLREAKAEYARLNETESRAAGTARAAATRVPSALHPSTLGASTSAHPAQAVHSTPGSKPAPARPASPTKPRAPTPQGP